MAYYYVKSGGTAAIGTNAGRYTKQQTGSFASIGDAGYYNCITDAIGALTVPAGGDYICVSSAHAYSTSAQVSYTGISLRTSDSHFLVTVSDSAAGTLALAGQAQEHVTGGTSDVSFSSGQWLAYGIWFKSDDNINFSFNQTAEFEKCTFEVTGTTDIVANFTTNTMGMRFVECTFIGVSGAFVDFGSAGEKTFIRCTFGDGTFTNCYFIAGAGDRVNFIDCDLSNLTSSSIITNLDGTSVGGSQIQFLGCKMPASPTFGLIAKAGTSILLANSSNTSAAAEYQYRYIAMGGQVESNTSIYRTATTAFPSGQKISLRCDTDTYAYQARPFRFKLPGTFAALSAGASKHQVSTCLTGVHNRLVGYLRSSYTLQRCLFLLLVIQQSQKLVKVHSH